MLTFNKKYHKYEWCGSVVPSVTQILKFGGLVQDFNCIDPVILEIARNKGERIHRETEKIDSLICDVEEFCEYGDIYKLYLDKTNKIYRGQLYIEEQLYSQKYKFAGTIDRFVISKDKIIIADIKTGHKSVGIEHQLGAYKILIEENYKNEVSGKQIECYIIKINTSDRRVVVKKINEQTDCFVGALKKYYEQK